jgi:hypothetical protein
MKGKRDRKKLYQFGYHKEREREGERGREIKYSIGPRLEK